jgi:hypothetical protein
MHGNRANVILLLQSDSAIANFRSHLKTDLTLSLATLNHNIDFSEQNSFKRICRIYAPAYYFTFGKLVWQYWNDKIRKKKPIQGLWPEFQSLLQRIRIANLFNNRKFK